MQHKSIVAFVNDLQSSELNSSYRTPSHGAGCDSGRACNQEVWGNIRSIVVNPYLASNCLETLLLEATEHLHCLRVEICWRPLQPVDNEESPEESRIEWSLVIENQVKIRREAECYGTTIFVEVTLSLDRLIVSIWEAMVA